uniref:bacteriohemerythrin n=1 Tax=Agathobacter sp. TaxID=2021311 RepID=UPI0040573DCB
MYQFTKDCLIGIPQIDKEHEHLFELVNTAHAALTSSDADHIFITKNILVKLQNYARTHFIHEEEYMESIHDPELPLQKKEHVAFTKKIEELMGNTDMDVHVLNETLTFLTRWLYHHILSSDMMIGKSIIATKDNPFAFTRNFHTGIPLIDEEHKQLFAIIAKTSEVIHAELLHDKYDEIMGILTQLRQYTEMHFADEEAYMEEISYPDIEAQKRAHSAFVEKLVEIDLFDLDSMDDNQQEYLENLIEFLSGWLINHILNMDKRIAEFAATK